MEKFEKSLVKKYDCLPEVNFQKWNFFFLVLFVLLFTLRYNVTCFPPTGGKKMKVRKLNISRFTCKQGQLPQSREGGQGQLWRRSLHVLRGQKVKDGMVE